MNIERPGKNWQELYRAALFETDKTKIAERIAEAEQVIVARVRSLFHDPDTAWAEHNALDAAFYALNVLKFYSHVPQNASHESALPVFQSTAFAKRRLGWKAQPSRLDP